MIPLPRQLVSRGQTGRTGPDNGRLFRPGLEAGNLNLQDVRLVRGQTLEIADGNGVIHLSPAAVGLAGMRTDAAQGAGQRQDVHDDLHWPDR